MPLTDIFKAIANPDRRAQIHAAVSDVLVAQQNETNSVMPLPMLYKEIPHALSYDGDSKLHHLLHEKKGAEASGRKHLLTLLHFLTKYSECISKLRQCAGSQVRLNSGNPQPPSFSYIIMFAHIMTPHMYFILGFFPNIRVIFVEQERTSPLPRPHMSASLPETTPSETWHANLHPSQKPWYLSKEQLSKSLRQFIHCSSKSVAYIRTDPTISFLLRLKKSLSNLHITQMGLFSDIQMLESSYPSDADILWCLSRQAHFVYYLEPAYSSIKFKLPFQSNQNLSLSKDHADEMDDFKFTFDVDLMSAYKRNEYTYFEGDIYTQPFGAASSTETRIHIDTSTPALCAQRLGTFIPYPTTQEYENRMFYYNSIQRVFGIFTDPLQTQPPAFVKECTALHTSALGRRKSVGCATTFDGCLSCSLERHIWKQYHDVVAPICIRSAISDLTHVLGQPDVHQARTVMRIMPHLDDQQRKPSTRRT